MAGRVTLARPSQRTFGITAAHVIRGFRLIKKRQTLGVLLGDADISNLASRVIDVSDKLDLATIDLKRRHYLKGRSGWSVFSLSLWPPQPPLPDHGINMAVFPACLRQSPATGPSGLRHGRC